MKKVWGEKKTEGDESLRREPRSVPIYTLCTELITSVEL